MPADRNGLLEFMGYTYDKDKIGLCKRCKFSQWVENESVENDNSEWWGGLVCFHRVVLECGILIRLNYFHDGQGTCKFGVIDPDK